MNEQENPYEGCGKYVPTGHESSYCGPNSYFAQYVYCEECKKKQRELREK